MKQRITELLLELGIRPNVNGFNNLRDAILCIIEDEKRIKQITKVVYPMVAKQNNSTVLRVERSIRHAISNALAAKRLQPALNKMLRVKICNDDEHLTNTEVIAFVSEKVLMESL